MQNDDEDNKSLEDYQYFKISFSSVDGTYHAKILPANQISTEALFLSSKGYHNIRICFIPQ